MKTFKTLAFILLAAALAAGLIAIVSCTTGDGTPGTTTPTDLGDDSTDFDPPVTGGGVLSIVPTGESVTIPVTYGGGDYFYFYATGGDPPFSWSNTTPMLGSVTALDNYGDGAYRSIRYTLRAFNGTGTDTVIVTDATGATDTATVSISAATIAGLQILPSSVTLSNAVGGEQVTFTASGGVPPYYWFNTRTDKASIASANTRATYVLNIAFTGTDTVTLRDSMGSSVTATVTVTVPAP